LNNGREDDPSYNLPGHNGVFGDFNANFNSNGTHPGRQGLYAGIWTSFLSEYYIWHRARLVSQSYVYRSCRQVVKI